MQKVEILKGTIIFIMSSVKIPITNFGIYISLAQSEIFLHLSNCFYICKLDPVAQANFKAKWVNFPSLPFNEKREILQELHNRLIKGYVEVKSGIPVLTYEGVNPGQTVHFDVSDVGYWRKVTGLLYFLCLIQIKIHAAAHIISGTYYSGFFQVLKHWSERLNFPPSIKSFPSNDAKFQNIISRGNWKCDECSEEVNLTRQCKCSPPKSFPKSTANFADYNGIKLEIIACNQVSLYHECFEEIFGKMKRLGAGIVDLQQELNELSLGVK